MNLLSKIGLGIMNFFLSMVYVFLYMIELTGDHVPDFDPKRMITGVIGWAILFIGIALIVLKRYSVI